MDTADTPLICLPDRLLCDPVGVDSGFTWFASAYDTDDPAYRLAVLVQMVGITFVLAAGIPRFLADLDPTVGVVGYVILRLGNSVVSGPRVSVLCIRGRRTCVR